MILTRFVVRPRIHKRLVTSRNIRAISSSDFQFDVKATVAAVVVSQPPTLDLAHLVDAYNDGLRQVIDRHAPSVTRLSAYRKDHSTETAVLSVLDGLLVNSDERLVSLVALLDLSAAFDTLDHSVMLKSESLKLENGAL
nr:hypothetical protein BaRGS_026734 [Batillaria attramentaria]